MSVVAGAAVSDFTAPLPFAPVALPRTGDLESVELGAAAIFVSASESAPFEAAVAVFVAAVAGGADLVSVVAAGSSVIAAAAVDSLLVVVGGKAGGGGTGMVARWTAITCFAVFRVANCCASNHTPPGGGEGETADAEADAVG